MLHRTVKNTSTALCSTLFCQNEFDGLLAHAIGKLGTTMCLELRDADARAVELTHDVLGAFPTFLRILWDKVCGPEDWQPFLFEPKRWHQLWQTGLDAVVEPLVLRTIWFIEGVFGVAADCRKPPM